MTQSNTTSKKKEQLYCFIRHGEAQNNVGSDYWWVPNTQLTDNGIKRLKNKDKPRVMKEIKEKCNGTIDLIVSSPLKRALQTTNIIFNDIIDKKHTKKNL